MECLCYSARCPAVHGAERQKGAAPRDGAHDGVQRRGALGKSLRPRPRLAAAASFIIRLPKLAEIRGLPSMVTHSGLITLYARPY
jgi:hypothetical protein